MATFTTGLIFGSAPQNNEGNMQIADKNYFLDAEGKLTTNEEDARIRLINEGQEIPAEMAAEYDFGGKVAQKDAAPAPEAADAEAPAKASAKKTSKGAK